MSKETRPSSADRDEPKRSWFIPFAIAWGLGLLWLRPEADIEESESPASYSRPVSELQTGEITSIDYQDGAAMVSVFDGISIFDVRVSCDGNDVVEQLYDVSLNQPRGPETINYDRVSCDDMVINEADGLFKVGEYQNYWRGVDDRQFNGFAKRY